MHALSQALAVVADAQQLPLGPYVISAAASSDGIAVATQLTYSMHACVCVCVTPPPPTPPGAPHHVFALPTAAMQSVQLAHANDCPSLVTYRHALPSVHA
jgi:hypothetical protein